MSYTNETFLTRLPLGRPITPKEHDRNWDNITTMLSRIKTEFGIRMPDPVNTTPGIDGPKGKAYMIMEFSGYASAIPDGWQLSDGTNDTIDMTDKFVKGSNGNNVGTGGGTLNTSHVHTNPDTDPHTLTVAEIPPHGHDLEVCTASGDNVAPPGYICGLTIGGAQTNSGKISGGGGGGSHKHTQGNTGNASIPDNQPPYYVLAFIAFVDKQHA